MPRDAPDNVKFFDLGTGGLAQLFGLQLGEALELPIRNASVVIKAMRFMFEKWPRLVAEYKPAFGSIFARYLKKYTHWGYCDLDMVRNLTRTRTLALGPSLTLALGPSLTLSLTLTLTLTLSLSLSLTLTLTLIRALTRTRTL